MCPSNPSPLHGCSLQSVESKLRMRKYYPVSVLTNEFCPLPADECPPSSPITLCSWLSDRFPILSSHFSTPEELAKLEPGILHELPSSLSISTKPVIVHVARTMDALVKLKPMLLESSPSTSSLASPYWFHGTCIVDPSRRHHAGAS